MIKELKSGIRKPRAKAFLLFLLGAFLAWFISRLSETYSHTISFRMHYENHPDSLILLTEPPGELGVRVRANGFQLLRYQVSPKAVQVDLSEIQQARGRFFIAPALYRRQVEDQMDDALALLEMPADTLYLNFQKLRSRTVPVRMRVNIELAQNHMLDGPVRVQPERIHLLGPPAEIDTIRELLTEPLSLTGVRDTVRAQVRLSAAGRLPNTQFSVENVTVVARVFRFSETVVEVPVEVVNRQGSEDVKTFPPTVGILCKGRVESLKDLKPSDFRVVADFSQPDPESGRLPLELLTWPDDVNSSVLLETSVEFLIRNE